MRNNTEHKEAAIFGQGDSRRSWRGARQLGWTLALWVGVGSAGSAVATESESLRLELRSSEDRIGGYVTEPGPCRFEVGRRILDAKLEGRSLVGVVLLCHAPASCGERAYPFLGLPRPDRKGWVAQLTEEEGCSSPAIQGGRLVLDGELEPAAAAQVAHVPAPVGAAKKAKDALARGRQLLGRRDFAGASSQFLRALSYEEGRWDGYLGLGESELRRGNLDRAAEALGESEALARVAGVESPEIFFFLACVQNRQGKPRQALESIRRAIRMGLEKRDRLTTEPELMSLHGMPEFEVLSARVGAKRPSISPVRAEKRSR